MKTAVSQTASGGKHPFYNFLAWFTLSFLTFVGWDNVFCRPLMVSKLLERSKMCSQPSENLSLYVALDGKAAARASCHHLYGCHNISKLLWANPG